MRVILQKEKLKVFINGSLVNEVNVSTSNLTSGKIGFGGPGKGTMQIRRISIKDLSYVPAISGFYFSKMKDFKSMEITKGLKLIYRNEKDNTDVSKYGQGVIEFISEVKREGKKYLFKDQSGKVRALTIVGDGLLKLDSTGNYFVRIKDY